MGKPTKSARDQIIIAPTVCSCELSLSYKKLIIIGYAFVPGKKSLSIHICLTKNNNWSQEEVRTEVTQVSLSRKIGTACTCFSAGEVHIVFLLGFREPLNMLLTSKKQPVYKRYKQYHYWLPRIKLFYKYQRAGDLQEIHEPCWKEGQHIHTTLKSLQDPWDWGWRFFFFIPAGSYFFLLLYLSRSQMFHWLILYLQ